MCHRCFLDMQFTSIFYRQPGFHFSHNNIQSIRTESNLLSLQSHSQKLQTILHTNALKTQFSISCWVSTAWDFCDMITGSTGRESWQGRILQKYFKIKERYFKLHFSLHWLDYITSCKFRIHPILTAPETEKLQFLHCLLNVSIS